MSDEDKILKFFRTYFTETKIKQDFAQKILKHAEHYETKQRPKEFLQKFFDSLKKSYDHKNPKNFVTACKRFLFIINKLLGAEVRKEKQGKYNQLISQQIVRYYLFFFEIIFKNSLHELIVDLKMYRMKWARLISDQAFINLRQSFYVTKGKKFIEFRQQIKKKHNNFNLNRGFSQENMEKLKKIHQKRGLTTKQSIDQKEQTKQATPQQKYERSSDSSHEQSGNEQDITQKRVKTEFNGENQLNYQIPGYANYGGYNPGYMPNPPPYESQHFQQFAEERMRPPFNQPTYKQNAYPSVGQNYPTEKSSLQSTPQTNASVYSLSPIRVNSTYFGYSNYPNPSEPVKPQMAFEFREVPEQRRQETNFSNLYKINCMRKELQQNLFKCRQCGECFQTGENHHKHMNDHFFASLEKISEAQSKVKVKKQGKIKLLDLKNWETVQKPTEKEEYRFEVLLSELPDQHGEKVRCYFCNEQLEITFSAKYEDWVLTDAIKINEEGKVDIIHFGCYESFKSDQNSSVSS